MRSASPLQFNELGMSWGRARDPQGEHKMKRLMVALLFLLMAYREKSKLSDPPPSEDMAWIDNAENRAVASTPSEEDFATESDEETLARLERERVYDEETRELERHIAADVEALLMEQAEAIALTEELAPSDAGIGAFELGPPLS